MKETFAKIQTYLSRLQYPGPIKPNWKHLAALQWQHLHQIPFENLDIHLGREILLDLDRIYQKVVPTYRGGFCFEVNSLFHWLLQSLGFNAYLISCAVYMEVHDAFGADGGHAAVMVLIDGQKWLVDVGFGDGIQKPVILGGQEADFHSYRYYQVFALPGGNYQLMKSEDQKKWIPMYRFLDMPVNMPHFQTMCRFHQTSASSPFTQRRLCTKLTKEGRITLAGDRLIITGADQRSEVVITNAQYDEYLQQYFDIVL